MTRPFAFLKFPVDLMHTFASRSNRHSNQSLQKSARVWVILILILTINTRVSSQNLTLTELFNICKKENWDEVNEFLQKKGWEYYESSKGDDEHYSTITWSFQKESYNDNAQGWFYLYTFEGLPNKISCLITNKQTYNNLKTAINTAGMKLINSSIHDNEIETTYGNANFIVSVRTTKREREETYYEKSSLTTYSIDVINKAGVYDKDNGLKKIFDDDGNLESEFTLKDGKLHGATKSYYSNGQVKLASFFLNGKKHGISKEYDEEGNLTAEYTFQNGEPTGPYKQYENGKLKLSGSLISGKKNGQFKIYDSDGLLDIEYVAKDDLRDGKYTEYYYKDGILILKVTGQYLNGEKVGLWQTIKIKDKESEILDFTNYINGERNGAFKDVRQDSIIFGTYKNGNLHGEYRIFKNLSAWLTGVLDGDTTNSPLITKGYYTNGMKSGLWKFNSMAKSLVREGRYSNDLKTGEWKYYHEKYVDEKSNLLSYSGQLYLTENYELDKKNGKSVRLSYFDKQRVKCDTEKNKSLTPVDTCYSWKYIRVLETAYYKKDILFGPYEFQDSTGRVVSKGSFINNEKDGEWTESYVDSGVNGDEFYVYLKGNYSNGKRTGLWIKYFEGDLIFASHSYLNGKLHGKSTQYLSADKPREEQFFENGYLKKVNAFDSLGNSIRDTYEILSETESEIKCRRTQYNAEGKVSQTYRIKKDSPEPLNQDFFEFYFLIKTGKLSDGVTGFLDGELKVFNPEGKLVLEGALLKEAKVGLWKYYYYDLDIYTEQEFLNNTGGVEKFYSLNTGKPYSGKFIRKHPNGKVKNEFKISDGLRNGTSKYFDETGKLEKSTKYEKGVLVK